MRIAVNASEGFRETLTGTGVYVRNLIRGLQLLSPKEEFAFLGILRPGSDTRFVGSESLVLLRCPDNRTFWSQVRIPAHLVRNRYDLVHFPDHKLPRWTGSRTVVTIHDLACLRFPETFSPMHRQRLQWFTRDAARRSNHLIAVSESTRSDLVNLLKVNPSRVHVVHHGVDVSFFRMGRGSGRSRPYILSVGELQPRKNYLMLIRAFRKLCGQVSEKPELVIVGKPGWLWEPMRKAASENSSLGNVVLTGYLSDEQLRDLYAGALMVALPSLYEGFGIPVLEAMASGVPVVASNVSSFPEIVSDAGVLVSPYDEDAWVEEMLLLYRDEGRRNQLAQKGTERVKHFDWLKTAEETLAVYQHVIAHRNDGNK